MKLEFKKNLTVTCYVALGSNIGDSRAYLQKAVDDLVAHHKIHMVKTSRFYQSKPHGPQNQADYINAVVTFKTDLPPETLLDVLQKIENDNDRVREGVIRWGARTLDLDLLFYADEIINSKRLTVPHPRICERAFVLLPLRNLLGTTVTENLKIHGISSILECIDALPNEELNNTRELGEELSKELGND